MASPHCSLLDWTPVCCDMDSAIGWPITRGLGYIGPTGSSRYFTVAMGLVIMHLQSKCKEHRTAAYRTSTEVSRNGVHRISVVFEQYAGYGELLSTGRKGHALSDSLPEIQHLHQDVKLLGGNLYYLVPLPLPSPKVEKKKVRFSDQEEGDGQRTGIVRIKLVISKQELQELLQKGGVSVQDMVSQIQVKQTTNDVDTFHGGDNCKGWKPELESIPEVD
ncbi:hypothetical protein JRO89_XS05G0110400 [Xanthoceras sorbifolium]|uniref:Uncharacterized protein n=1 Tax=Xanthoceras sorbifolium TaxID=99658 RepID=A0ABQ8I1H1_9ROSI|nr:hypothetical protein JRO89_XS05G0110400 [Xanthoceras sorbifolium]